MSNVFIVLAVSVAVSYGWGMRGSLLGGERGAVLPGALLGMFLALFSGNEIIAENFYIFAAAGASSMAFGGTETYGQTLGFILHRGREDYAPVKGYVGVFLKGALWQGICGAVIGMSFSAVSGNYYNGVDIIIVLALIPLVQSLGVQLFNKPYNKNEGKFPRIYFSIDRREEWGGNVLTLLMLLVFTLIRGDWYAFLFSVVGIIGGGAGFSLGMVIYDFVNHPMKNGKMFAGKFNAYIGGWKTMEFTFGAIAGLFFAIYFVLTKDTMLAERIGGVQVGVPVITSPLTEHAELLSYISLVLVPIVKIINLFEDKVGDHIIDLVERPVLYVIPMILALSGCELSAKLNAFALIVLFAGEKVVFERSRKSEMSKRILLGVIFGICTAAAVLLCIFTDIPPVGYMLMFTVYYIFADTVSYKKPSGSGITVLTYFLLQSVFLIVTTVCIS